MGDYREYAGLYVYPFVSTGKIKEFRGFANSAFWCEKDSAKICPDTNSVHGRCIREDNRLQQKNREKPAHGPVVIRTRDLRRVKATS